VIQAAIHTQPISDLMLISHIVDFVVHGQHVVPRRYQIKNQIYTAPYVASESEAINGVIQH